MSKNPSLPATKPTRPLDPALSEQGRRWFAEARAQSAAEAAEVAPRRRKDGGDGATDDGGWFGFGDGDCGDAD